MPEAATPVTPLDCEVQLNVAPGVALVMLTACVLWPEHTVCGTGVNSIPGTGFTTTFKVSGGPGHPLATGVMM